MTRSLHRHCDSMDPPSCWGRRGGDGEGKWREGREEREGREGRKEVNREEGGGDGREGKGEVESGEGGGEGGEEGWRVV